MFTKSNSSRYNLAYPSRERLLSSVQSVNFNNNNNVNNNEKRQQRSCCNSLFDGFAKKINDVYEFTKKAIEMGRSDRRKIFFAFKSGLAMAIVSLLIFWKQPFGLEVSQYSIWAMLTVIVVFEFTVGATLIKGFNRGFGTLSAGIFAYCFVAFIKLTGHWEQVIFVITLALTAFFAAYLKLHPSMIPYEYGFRVFVLTYCILIVAGQKTGQYSEPILIRLALFLVGGIICFLVNICIYPIWAGEDLHRSVVKNFRDLSASLEGCVKSYLESVEYTRIPSKILNYQDNEEPDYPVYNGYRAVVESRTREQTLLNFALWEPAHGRYNMSNYPWRNYVRVSGALRHCAFMVMALHGCVLSEIQASREKRQLFLNPLQKVGIEGAKVLNEIGDKVEKMEKLGTDKILKEVHAAAEQLQLQIDQKLHLLLKPENPEAKKHPNQLENSESFSKEQYHEIMSESSLSEALIDFRSIRKLVPWPSSILLEGDATITEDELKTRESASALSLATFASLLVEFVARLQNVVDTFEDLSEKANFQDPALIPSDAITRTGFWTRMLRLFGYKK